MSGTKNNPIEINWATAKKTDTVKIANLEMEYSQSLQSLNTVAATPKESLIQLIMTGKALSDTIKAGGKEATHL